VGVDKLARLGIDERRKLEPFPLVSPSGDAIQIHYKSKDGRYIIAKPYDVIYREDRTILTDMAKAFTQKREARGTLLIGPKATGKSHLLGIEIDYAKGLGAKVILINRRKEYSFAKLADINISKREALREGLVASIARALGASTRDIEGIREALSSKGWETVQIAIDDIYETDLMRRELIEDLTDLLSLQTTGEPPIVRVSAAFHTGRKFSAADFFDAYIDELRVYTIGYEEGKEIVEKSITSLLNGDILLGASLIPIVTEWSYTSTGKFLEDAFEDFFNKYVSMRVEDKELRDITLRDLCTEDFIYETVLKAMRGDVYRVFADAARYLWRNYKGKKLGPRTSIEHIKDTWKILISEFKEKESTRRLHLFYRDLLSRFIDSVMKVREAKYVKTRRYVIRGGEVKWRTIDLYVVNGTEIAVVIPSLTTRKSGIVVERPREVSMKIRDILDAHPRAYVIALVTKNVDTRGLRDLLGVDRYALILAETPNEDNLRYFYAPIIAKAFDKYDLQRILAKRLVKVTGSKDVAYEAFLGVKMSR